MPIRGGRLVIQFNKGKMKCPKNTYLVKRVHTSCATPGRRTVHFEGFSQILTLPVVHRILGRASPHIFEVLLRLCGFFEPFLFGSPAARRPR